MPIVDTKDGGIEESALCWRVWREDAGESWTIVHELTDREGQVVRRDSWVIFKASGIPAVGALKGEL